MPPKKSTKSPGDHTGRKTEELRKQHAKELADRENELSMAQAAEEEERQEGVTDFTGGQAVEYDDGDDITDVIGGEAPQQRTLAPGTRQPSQEGTGPIGDYGLMPVEGQGPVRTNDTAILGQGPETPFDVVGATPYDERMRDVVDQDSPTARRFVNQHGGNRGVEELGVELSSSVEVIRVNTDLPEVTIGVGNHYNFEAGRQYRVPRNVAQHLREKGYA